VGVPWGEGEEVHHGLGEGLDVGGLFLFAADGAGGLALGVLRRGAFGGDLGADALDGGGGGPDALRERLAATLFLHRPCGPGGLETAGQEGIAGRDEGPVGGGAEGLAVGGADRAAGAGGDDAGLGWHGRRIYPGAELFGRRSGRSRTRCPVAWKIAPAT